jgi:hypothetical protein
MFVVKTFAHNLNKEEVSCSRLILFAKLLVFWVAYNDIFIGSLSSLTLYLIYRIIHEKIPMKISLYATQNTRNP